MDPASKTWQSTTDRVLRTFNTVAVAWFLADNIHFYHQVIFYSLLAGIYMLLDYFLAAIYALYGWFITAVSVLYSWFITAVLVIYSYFVTAVSVPYGWFLTAVSFLCGCLFKLICTLYEWVLAAIHFFYYSFPYAVYKLCSSFLAAVYGYIAWAADETLFFFLNGVLWLYQALEWGKWLRFCTKIPVLIGASIYIAMYLRRQILEANPGLYLAASVFFLSHVPSLRLIKLLHGLNRDRLVLGFRVSIKVFCATILTAVWFFDLKPDWESWYYVLLFYILYAPVLVLSRGVTYLLVSAHYTLIRRLAKVQKEGYGILWRSLVSVWPRKTPPPPPPALSDSDEA
ncbi:hypothetical protein GGR52DRAFT_569540 [Hypoxylon sp. FL1284]|nr:hypothetical protein GGR52DRAFT_569540 [Hypoxylon sp. FL1284]